MIPPPVFQLFELMIRQKRINPTTLRVEEQEKWWDENRW